MADDTGRFTLADTPSGEYDLRVAGLWKPSFDPNWYHFRVSADPGSNFEQTFAVVPGTAAENNRPNLKVSAVFDRPAYTTSDRPRVTITVTNLGEVAAEHVTATQDFAGPTIFVPFNGWGEFTSSGPGAHLEPGETRVFDVSGDLEEDDADTVLFSAGLIAANGDINSSNNGFSIAAPVTTTFGNFTGVAFLDENQNGVFDPGEELPGARISLDRPFPDDKPQLVRLTDAQGRFAFTGIVTGRYFFGASLDQLVISHPDFITVGEDDNPALVLRVVRPLRDLLPVTMTFGQDTYRVGDPVRITIGPTNNGPIRLDHVRAFCEHDPNGAGLDGTAEGWGPLRPTAEGITIAPGESRTITVTDTVPAPAAEQGFVGASCRFGPDDDLENPFAFDTAGIAGKTGKAQGRLVHVSRATAGSTTRWRTRRSCWSTRRPPAGLASTGASVLGLIVMSLGLLVAGFGAVVFTRRRRESRG